MNEQPYRYPDGKTPAQETRDSMGMLAGFILMLGTAVFVGIVYAVAWGF